ncbi:prepilin-type N-terminal cleavage/methylation domain-containing protein [Puniceicoccaceae bacterium K14]|nr:prepilin-type N-terminal cleavage/methylation domain-containing protein [Puniceicoccaceae bacterium K14]
MMKLKKTKAGFTLLELIIAVSITALLSLVAFQMLDGIVSVWKIADENISVESEAQFALEQIGRDLESVVFKKDNGPMFAVDVLKDDLNSGNWDSTNYNFGKPASNPTHFDPADNRYGWAGCWVRFFCASPTLNAVSYQIIRAKPESGINEPRYSLFRTAVSNRFTMESGYNIKDANSYELPNPQSEVHPGAIKSPDTYQSILAENVIDFGVRLFVYDDAFTPSAAIDVYTPTGMRLVFPSDSNGVLDSTDTSHIAPIFNSVSADYPDAVEVYIRVINPLGAEKLREIEQNGPNNSAWYSVVEEHSKLFTKFIRIPSQAF